MWRGFLGNRREYGDGPVRQRQGAPEEGLHWPRQPVGPGVRRRLVPLAVQRLDERVELGQHHRTCAAHAIEIAKRRRGSSAMGRTSSSRRGRIVLKDSTQPRRSSPHNAMTNSDESRGLIASCRQPAVSSAKKSQRSSSCRSSQCSSEYSSSSRRQAWTNWSRARASSCQRNCSAPARSNRARGCGRRRPPRGAGFACPWRCSAIGPTGRRIPNTARKSGRTTPRRCGAPIASGSEAGGPLRGRPAILDRRVPTAGDQSPKPLNRWRATAAGLGPGRVLAPTPAASRGARRAPDRWIARQSIPAGGGRPAFFRRVLIGLGARSLRTGGAAARPSGQTGN